MHAIKTGEGHAFISAGVEAVSRHVNGWSDNPEGQNPVFTEAQRVTDKRAGGGAEAWVDPRTTGALPDGTVVSTDDGPRSGTTLAGVSQVKPVFRPDGTVTAGNACPLNGGAAALVVMSDVRAKELGLASLARIVSTPP